MAPKGSRLQILAPILLLIAVLWGFELLAGELDVHPGYLVSVEGERYQLSREIIIVPDAIVDRLTLKERIFTDKLSRDFQRRYESQFGRTQGEQIGSVPMRFFEKELSPGIFVSEEEYVNKQRKFGQYMGRRLVEHHFDSYMRENPSARPVLELKEKVSDVNVKMKNGYKVRFKYSFSGNYLDINLENPYNIGAKLTLEDMGSTDTIFALSYPFTKTVTLLADYRDYQDTATVSAVKHLTASLSTSVTAVNNSYENKGLVSMRWVD